MGGFTALLNIRTATACGGYSDGGYPLIRAKMTLEGSLLELHYGEFRGYLPKDVESVVSVEIEFTENQERCDDIDEKIKKSYIGLIQLQVSANKIWSTLRLTLPILMYKNILLLGESNLVLDTIHDSVENPSNRETKDNVVAYVTRVYFERKHWWDMKENKFSPQ